MSATAASAPPVGLPALSAVLARARTENFPVASRLLGRRERTQLLSIYGFARLVDDVGDELAGDRSAALEWLEQELDRVYAGAAPEHPVMRGLAVSVRAAALPRGPFERLIEANRRDQVVNRYRSFEELLDYCQLSAAPVGELVLCVFGAATPERVRLSDLVCAALQLTEHLQDVAEDYARGRVYLPGEDLARVGCGVEEFGARVPSSRFAELMAFEVARARSLLAEGALLLHTLRGRPMLAVAGFVAGGRAALAALEDAGYDVLGGHPRPSRLILARALVQTLRAR